MVCRRGHAIVERQVRLAIAVEVDAEAGLAGGDLLEAQRAAELQLGASAVEGLAAKQRRQAEHGPVGRARLDGQSESIAVGAERQVHMDDITDHVHVTGAEHVLDGILLGWSGQHIGGFGVGVEDPQRAGEHRLAVDLQRQVVPAPSLRGPVVEAHLVGDAEHARVVGEQIDIHRGGALTDNGRLQRRRTDRRGQALRLVLDERTVDGMGAEIAHRALERRLALLLDAAELEAELVAAPGDLERVRQRVARAAGRPGCGPGLNRRGVLGPGLDQRGDAAKGRIHGGIHGVVPGRRCLRSPGFRGGRGRLALNRWPAARRELARPGHLARCGTRGPPGLTAGFYLLGTTTLPLVFLHDRLLGAAARSDMVPHNEPWARPPATLVTDLT